MIVNLDKSHLEYLSDTKNRFLDAWSLDMLENALNLNNLDGFVLINEDKPIGYITYSTSFETADIFCVFVEKEFRRRGYAKELLKIALEHLRALKIKNVLLEVRSSNESAINLYKSFGFNVIHQREKYYFDGEDALVLIKEI